MDTISADELVFFGSLQTNLAYHPGSIHLCQFDSLTEESITSQSLVDADEQQIVLPDLPTSFIQIKTNTDNIQSICSEFNQPLIKTNLPSRLKGIVSGVRSALIKSKSSKWYRLKGCGNNTDGFLIQSISDSNTKLTIRGCAFLHTTYRELFMTNYISNLLSQHHIECANKSIGWFEYKSHNENLTNMNSDIPIIQDINLNQWPNIVRCCIVMETLGNKRLSDHVLYGIEQLFHLIICDDRSHPVNQSNLISLFPCERLTQSDRNTQEQVPLPTWFACLSDTLQPIDYQKFHWFDSSSYFSDQIPSDVDENLWKMNIQSLNKYLKTEKSLPNLFCLLYKRFGYECGSILGLMHYHRISWGTYTDELGVHCNAHPNNLVIKFPSSTSASFLLAPLDFDMSFIETNYKRNKLNDQSFDEIIKLEFSGFQLTLAGDSQASTGVTSWIEMIDDQWTSIRWLLRDIMLNEFNKTYNYTIQNGTIDSMGLFSNEQYSALQVLIRLALIKTMKEIG